MQHYEQLSPDNEQPGRASDVMLEFDIEEPSPLSPRTRRSFLHRHPLLLSLSLALLLFTILLILLSSLSSTASHHLIPRTPLILISIDGFRHSYLTYNITPVLSSFLTTGAFSQGLLPQFPAKTFPNHYTLVTGLYPLAHGIVSNQFYDHHLHQSFSYRNSTQSTEPLWWHGEPIWHTLQRETQAKERAFIGMWPGSEVKDHRSPDVVLDYAAHWNWTSDRRVDQILEWMDGGPQHDPRHKQQQQPPPTLMAMYFSEVDDMGHGHGSDPSTSPQLASAIRHVDKAMGKLIQGLDDRGLLGTTNVMLVSDHGMQTVEREYDLDEILSGFEGSLEVVDHSPLVALRYIQAASPPDASSSLDSVLEELKRRAVGKEVQVHTPSTLPPRFHYSSSDPTSSRLPDILLLSEPGSVLVSKSKKESWLGHGTHGYDPQHVSMHGIFMGRGPGFFRGIQVDLMENVEVYGVLCRLLDVRPADNNGTMREYPFLTVG